MNRVFTTVALVAAIVALGAVSANAAPLSLTVDSSQSTINLIVGAIGGSATGGVLVTVSGTSTGDGTTAIGLGEYINALDISSSVLALTDGSLVISLGFLGGVTAATFGLGADLTTNGPIAATNTAVGVSTLDPGGSDVTLNAGFITYKGTGAVGGLLGSGTFDFVNDPTGVTIPSAPGSVVVTLEQIASPIKGVTVFIPLNVTSTITTDPVDVTATLVGQIILTGTLLIPEPGTLALMGVGLIGLIPVIRRRFRRG